MQEIFFPSEQTEVLIQGITGKEGTRMSRWMRASGARVVAGVSPGKGGTVTDRVPVFNTVKEACRAFPNIQATCIVVPGRFVKEAAYEALTAGIRFLHILSESVPVHDVIAMRLLARKSQATILGPASVGAIFSPGLRLGYLGGEQPFPPTSLGGNIALLSNSGGMSNELMIALRRAHMGLSLGLALGGNLVTGLLLHEAFRLCAGRPDVKSILLFVEPGQPILSLLSSGTMRPSKPTVVYLAGERLDQLPRNIPYGHTGTIVGEAAVPISEMRTLLKMQGIACATSVQECLALLTPYVD